MTATTQRAPTPTNERDKDLTHITSGTKPGDGPVKALCGFVCATHRGAAPLPEIDCVVCATIWRERR